MKSMRVRFCCRDKEDVDEAIGEVSGLINTLKEAFIDIDDDEERILAIKYSKYIAERVNALKQMSDQLARALQHVDIKG